YSSARNALQDLIIRLEDARRGFMEIYDLTNNFTLRQWMQRYSSEREEFKQALESHIVLLGGHPESHTSFLGDIHRMFIDIKLSNIDDDVTPIVNEIERGETTLIHDYKKIISEVELPANLLTTL